MIKARKQLTIYLTCPHFSLGIKEKTASESKRRVMGVMQPCLEPRCGHGKKGDNLAAVMNRRAGRSAKGGWKGGRVERRAAAGGLKSIKNKASKK